MALPDIAFVLETIECTSGFLLPDYRLDAGEVRSTFGGSKRFRAKACPGLDPGWMPVRVRKTRQNKNPEFRF
jgi:hypothetical protein